MGRGKDPAYRITEERRPGSSGPVAHILGVLVCLAGIVYLGLFLASRTQGFRLSVEDRLERALGLPVSLKRVEATPGLNLRLEGLASRDSEKNGRPGIRAHEVVLGWSLSGLVRPGPLFQRVVIRGGAITFAPGSSGRWEPAALEPLGAQVAQWGGFELPAPEAAGSSAPGDGNEAGPAAPSAEGAPTNTASWFEHVALEVRAARLAWWDAEGGERASAEGIDLLVTPVNLPNRPITHVHLTMDKGRVGNRQVQNLVFELIRTAEQDIILGYAGDWHPVAKGEPADAPEKPAGENPVTPD
ncbi:MAG TPA: hypothetical protein P5567_00750 [Kiritimatiellia bacterium]|nr:hypothetical protein [Kiritimatiellia bacterium]HRZ10963.1 hypothetical protein [Kiritimatiellia bacterium]HSA18536.1 hypothetical protein [Kiritimatiellia bacterium]